MRWFRFYSEALHEPKLLRLSDEQHRFWIATLCLANDGNPRGTVPSIPDIACELRAKETKIERLMNSLLVNGLMESNGDGTFSPHNWGERQRKSDDAATIKAGQRNKAKNVHGPSLNGTNHVHGQDDDCPQSVHGHVQGQVQKCPPLEQSRAEQTRTELASKGSHQECVELAFSLFGTKVANAVTASKANLASKLEDSDGRPNWSCFAAALIEVDRRRRTERGKKIEDVIAYAVTIAAEYIVNGVPPAPVAVEPVRPRVALSGSPMWTPPNVND